MKALVTGAANGLGRAIAEAVVDRGDDLVGLDLDLAGLESLGPRATPVVADLSDIKSLQTACNRIKGLGPFDLVVMNAGINATGRFEDIALEAQLPVIDINLTSPMVMTSHLIREDLIGNGGSLVFVSSLSRFVGYPGAATYAASKDGIAIFAKSIRKPLRKRNIQVSVVYPGPLDTAHAAQHAPPGASGKGRTAPEEAARIILAKMERGGTIVPGSGAAAMALFGRCFPGVATSIMRRIIFEPYDRVR